MLFRDAKHERLLVGGCRYSWLGKRSWREPESWQARACGCPRDVRSTTHTGRAGLFEGERAWRALELCVSGSQGWLEECERGLYLFVVYQLYFR